MTTLKKVLLPLLGISTLLGAIAAPVYAAGDINYGLQFSANNLNPWDVGTAFNKSQQFDLLNYSWNDVSLPALSGDPGSALMDVIGLSSLASVKLAASTSGNINLNAGYDVNGGVLNLKYAGNAAVSAPDTYSTGRVLTIGTGFSQGPVRELSPFFGGSAHTFTSGFTTTTPYADTYVNFNLNVTAGVTAQCHLFGVSCGSATIDIPAIHDQNLNLLNASTATGVSALGVGLLNFGQTTNLGGWGSLTVNSPEINVTGTPQADGTLSGRSTAGNILDLTFNGDQLIPFIGPLLKNNIGPLGYSLVSFTPEATLGVYQNLQFNPNIKTELQFSSPMMQILADGTKKLIDAGAPVFVNAGDPFNLLPTFAAHAANSLTVKPTYLFESNVHNITGLTLGGDLVVDGLTLNTPLGNVGPLPNPPPIPIATLDIPFWDKIFPVNIAPMALPTFQIENGDPPFKQLLTNGAFRYNPLAPPDPTGKTQFQFELEQSTGLSDWTASGQLITSSPGASLGCNDGSNGNIFSNPTICNAEQFFMADNDVIVDLFDHDLGGFVRTNLGNVFCVVCNDATSYLSALSNSLLDGMTIDNNPVYITDPALYLTGDNSNPNDPWLTENHGINSFTTTPLRITNLYSVPEPGTLALLGIGMVGLARRRIFRIGSVYS